MTHAGPGGKPSRGAKAGHVHTNLSHKCRGHPLIHPRDGVQELHLTGERGGRQSDLLREPIDQLVQVVRELGSQPLTPVELRVLEVAEKAG